MLTLKGSAFVVLDRSQPSWVPTVAIRISLTNKEGDVSIAHLCQHSFQKQAKHSGLPPLGYSAAGSAFGATARVGKAGAKRGSMPCTQAGNSSVRTSLS